MMLSLRNSAAAALAIAGLMIGAPADAAPVSIRAFAAEQVRLSTIAYRIGAASADLCRPTGLSGIIAHDLTEYGRSLRPAVSAAFSLTTGIGVVGIVPGSAAEHAGLRIDDEIIRVGNVSVEDGSAFQAAPKSYRRLDAFAEVLASALRSGSTQIVVRRNARLQTLELRGQPGCGGDVALANSSQLNAWSDGRRVVVTTAMTRLARSDDELAFVIAHEMAHNILGHSAGAGQRRGIFGGIAEARRDEVDADSYAVGLMTRAGYQPQGGVTFLHMLSKRMWWALSFDHPSFDRRIRTVASAISAMPRPTSTYAVVESLAPHAHGVSKEAAVIDRPARQSFALASYSPTARTFAGFGLPGFRSGRSCAY